MTVLVPAFAMKAPQVCYDLLETLRNKELFFLMFSLIFPSFLSSFCSFIHSVFFNYTHNVCAFCLFSPGLSIRGSAIALLSLKRLNKSVIIIPNSFTKHYGNRDCSITHRPHHGPFQAWSLAPDGEGGTMPHHMVFYVAECSTLRESWAVKARMLSTGLINVSVIWEV